MAIAPPTIKARKNLSSFNHYEVAAGAGRHYFVMVTGPRWLVRGDGEYLSKA